MLKIKDLHPALHGYEASYTNDLLPQLDPIETRRKALVRHIQKVIGLTLLITIVSIAVLFLLGSTTPLLSGIFFPIFVPVVLCGGLGYSIIKVKLFKGDTKQIIMDTIVAHLGWSFKGRLINVSDISIKGLRLKHTNSSSEGDIKSFVSGLSVFLDNGLLPKHTNSSPEDFIEGNYNGVDFTFYELHLSKKTNKDSYTVFRGLVLTFEPPREFSGRTVVLRDSKLLQFNKKHGMKRVGLVDPVFEKTFEAYSTDQVESRYLLTPDFMQRLVDLETAAHGKKIRFGFLEGKLCVALEVPNHFETGSIFSKLTDPAPVQKILNEVSALLHLMDGILEKQKLTKLS